jgi:hypothetical protein
MVKNQEIVNIEGPFEAEALRILRDVPGLTVVAEPGPGDRRVDAVLRFADQQALIAVEFKQQANAATAWQLVHYAEAFPDARIMLIAGETTAEARKILDDHGIALIDGLGNAHIELPGLMFHIEGRRRPSGITRPTRLGGKAGVAAQALLINPDRDWTVQDLAKEAGIATGLAHRVFARLEGEGIVAVEGTGPKRVRRVTNPTALLDLWAEEQNDRPARTLGHLLAQTPQQLIEQLGANLGHADIDYALTGAAGASLVAPFVTAIPVVDVWVTATAAPEELHHNAATDPVNEGQNVVFLQAKDDAPLAFREHTNEVWVANRFRLYADLRRDPRRGREQADHLREEVIKF